MMRIREFKEQLCLGLPEEVLYAGEYLEHASGGQFGRDFSVATAIDRAARLYTDRLNEDLMEEKALVVDDADDAELRKKYGDWT